MEMQFFILGHILLYAMCIIGVATAISAGEPKIYRPWTILPFASLFFVPLEIVYWGVHFALV